jgi:NAD(P)-dependent dehydrogenase (short-subunit alcohol dehydrogenase family)
MISRKKILITGAGGYLGGNLCFLFSKLNYDLICLDINKSKLNLLKKKLSKFKNNQYYFSVDITDEKKVIKVHNTLKRKKCIVDVIINNAANNISVKKTKNIRLMNIVDWKNDLNVGLMGAYIITKTFVDDMKKNNRGSIINIGSDLSVLSPNHEIYKSSNKNFLKPISYSVIKHGLVGLNKYFATLYAKDGIISNMISPGPIDFNIPNYLKKRLLTNTPMKKLCSIDEIFKLVIFLCDTEKRHITGQNILVDGGKSLI